ncbi:hypothetical protein BHE74_00006231 [Ensete ventricosum]|nr:hypothetical protein BHE74_00006231 [Ensete ventricosum]
MLAFSRTTRDSFTVVIVLLTKVVNDCGMVLPAMDRATTKVLSSKSKGQYDMVGQREAIAMLAAGDSYSEDGEKL